MLISDALNIVNGKNPALVGRWFIPFQSHCEFYSVSYLKENSFQLVQDCFQPLCCDSTDLQMMSELQQSNETTDLSAAVSPLRNAPLRFLDS